MDADRTRAERLAKNEAFFRNLNERIEQAMGRGADSSDKFEFVCECSNEGCFES